MKNRPREQTFASARESMHKVLQESERACKNLGTTESRNKCELLTDQEKQCQKPVI